MWDNALFRSWLLAESAQIDIYVEFQREGWVESAQGKEPPIPDLPTLVRCVHYRHRAHDHACQKECLPYDAAIVTIEFAPQEEAVLHVYTPLVKEVLCGAMLLAVRTLSLPLPPGFHDGSEWRELGEAALTKFKPRGSKIGDERD